jgi:hypothetical protein
MGINWVGLSLPTWFAYFIGRRILHARHSFWVLKNIANWAWSKRQYNKIVDPIILNFNTGAANCRSTQILPIPNRLGYSILERHLHSKWFKKN